MASCASSTTTLTLLCSSLTIQSKISHTPLSLSLSTSNFCSLCKPLSLSTPWPSLLPVSRFSNSEAPVLDAEPESNSEPEPEPEPASEQVVEAVVEEKKEEKPKREEIFAVVMIGSRQYIVIPGRKLYVQRLKGTNVNDKIALNKVLLVGTKTSTYIGKPVVTNAAVHAVVEEHGLDPKVVVFKYKAKKHYRRNIGHRQPNTKIKILGITGYEDYPAVTLESLNSSKN